MNYSYHYLYNYYTCILKDKRKMIYITMLYVPYVDYVQIYKLRG